MCGIAGIIKQGARKDELRDQIQKILKTIKHRGPDDQGEYIDTNLAIGMTRLSIIDIENGKQPISNSDNSVVLVCNGEIYNYRELKEALSIKGHTFKTNSDVEVILHGYLEYGVEFIHQLRGMFAFCLWDSRKKRIWLARDRLGIKPLYYSFDQKMFVFCSEIKGILSLRKENISFENSQIRIALTKRFNDSDSTVFKGIKKMPPGSYFLIENNQIKEKKYWQLNKKMNEVSNMDNYLSQYSEKLLETISSHLVSDVPIGSFLSGGLDSSMVTAISSQMMSKQMSTYTIGFDSVNTEHMFARQVSQDLGTNHLEEILKDIDFSTFEKAMFHLEEPINDPAVIPTFLLSGIASKSSKVVLTGEGSDEVNGGYNKYRYDSYNRSAFGVMLGLLPNKFLKKASENSMFYDNRISNSIRRRIGYSLSGNDSFLFSDSNMVSAINAFHLFSDDFLKDTENEYQESYEMTFGSSLNDYFLHDFNGFLANDLLLKVDKMTMAHSLEARVPFLDHKFIEYNYSIPGFYKLDSKNSKKILRKLSHEYLRDEISTRKQHGFLAPIDQWLMKDWKDDIKALVMDGFLVRENIVSGQSVSDLFTMLMRGNKNVASIIWALATMNMSYNLFSNREFD
ncbi:MAG: asparagine synthase (glutamine-hydrolyzing) [Candidatus Marinimicrobia bacterium]|nr:asparagine synthase (glutamine-hydrolyzing) [Candidatus Neomarinimicrobiota bacterium]